MNVNHRELLFDIAVRAGEATMLYYRKGAEVLYKPDNSPITIADTSAHEIIFEGLKVTGIPVVSEESDLPPYEERSKWCEYWIVDPIDGTKQFISGDDEFTVNIALIRDNAVYEGIVYAPALHLIYYGNCSDGAWRMNTQSGHKEKLPCVSHEDFRIAVSKSHLGEETKAFIEKCQKRFPHTVMEMVGSSYKFCLVAEGSVALYPRTNAIREWDIAAGHAVLKSAGGNVYNIKTGLEVKYNTVDYEAPCFFALYDISLIDALRACMK